MNKTTKHVYPGDLLRSARNHFGTITPDQGNLQHEWLFRFKEGLAVRAEITRFYRNFFVFHNNHLISPDDLRDTWSDFDYDSERLVPKSHVEETGVVNYILEGIKSSTAVTLTSGWWTKDDAETYVTQYFIKNFFTTIYKYVMGVYILYHYDTSYREMSNIIKKLGTYLKQYTLKGFIKLNEQFPQNEKILKIKNSLDNLKTDFEDFINSSVLYKIEGQELEEEEINKPFYYKWKRYCVLILGEIESLYDELGCMKLLEKYRRVSYDLKPKDYSEMSLDEIKVRIDTKFSINLMDFEVRAGMIQEDAVISIDILGDKARKSDVASMFRIKYIEAKKNVLLMKNPIIIGFMNTTEGHHDTSETFQEFIEKSLTGIARNLFPSLGAFNGFFLDPFYYILLRIWNNLLCESDEVRNTITDKMVWKEWSSIQEATDAEIMMQIVYKSYLDLYQLVSHKVYYDRNYKEIWDIYFNLSDIIKNVCEKNNQSSKHFFNKFSLALNIAATHESQDDMDRDYDFGTLRRAGTGVATPMDQSPMNSPGLSPGMKGSP
jgi:hypothetical protein